MLFVWFGNWTLKFFIDPVKDLEFLCGKSVGTL